LAVKAIVIEESCLVRGPSNASDFAQGLFLAHTVTEGVSFLPRTETDLKPGSGDMKMPTITLTAVPPGSKGVRSAFATAHPDVRTYFAEIPNLLELPRRCLRQKIVSDEDSGRDR
jgi:hypothetical protein